VLFFSEEFHQKNDSEIWSRFNNYLRAHIWDKTIFFRYFYQFGYVIAQAAAYANVRCVPIIINSIKQLTAISSGFTPGLAFHRDNNVFPNDLLCTLYREIYELEYPPLFMQTKHFEARDDVSVYYSLSLPGVLEFFPDFNPFKSKFDELRELAHATRKTQKALAEQDFGIRELEGSLFNGMVKNQINFYHSSAGQETNIKHAKEIPDLKNQGISEESFHSSSIFRGLIGIHKKN